MGPACSMLSVTVEPLASGTTSCRAIVFIPGPLATQVKLRPSSTSVTSHDAGGNLGCRTLTRDPTWNGPPSRRSTLPIVGVHSGQRATSNSTSQTGSMGESMCLVVSKNRFMYQMVHVVSGSCIHHVGRTDDRCKQRVCQELVDTAQHAFEGSRKSSS